MLGQTEGQMKGWKDGHTLFYRTLPATTRGPKTFLHLLLFNSIVLMQFLSEKHDCDNFNRVVL